MRIERVSENQVRIFLDRLDLDARNIKLTELAYGSEKAQELFRDIMERAHTECGFDSENLPLMIEATPHSEDSITIIVTKVKNQHEFEERFRRISRSDAEPKRSHNPQYGYKNNDHTQQHAEPHPEASTQALASNMFVFSFKSIDDAATVAARLKMQAPGAEAPEAPLPREDTLPDSESYDMLFKMDGKFYFVLSDDGTSRFGPIALEYGGQQHANTSLSTHYLMEHGELLIKDNATEKLAKYLA